MGDLLRLPNLTICCRSLRRFETQGLQRLSNQTCQTQLKHKFILNSNMSKAPPPGGAFFCPSGLRPSGQLGYIDGSTLSLGLTPLGSVQIH